MKIKKLENTKLRTSTFGSRSRIGIIAIVCLLIFAGYSGVNATIKLGEDGSGQKWFGSDTGLITNSNGKAWTVSETNLSSAISDLGGDFGYVYLHGDCSIELTSNLIIANKTTLDMRGSTFTIPADSSFDIITMGRESQLLNGYIDLSSVNNYRHNATLFDGAYAYRTEGRRTIIENMYYRGKGGGALSGNLGNGIMFVCDAAGENIYNVIVNNVNMLYFNNAIAMISTAGNGIHSNHISELDTQNCNVTFYLNSSDTIRENIFRDYMIQSSTGFVHHDISLYGTGCIYNKFYGYSSDFPLATETQIYSGGGARENEINCWLPSAAMNEVNNAGGGTLRIHNWYDGYDYYFDGNTYVKTGANGNIFDIFNSDGQQYYYQSVNADDSNITLYLPLSEGTGDIVYDKSMYRNDGTLEQFGAQDKWVDGKNGMGLTFDGTNDYVSIPYNDSINISGDGSIELWMKTSNWTGATSNSDRCVFSWNNYDSYMFTAQANCDLRLFSNTAGLNLPIGAYVTNNTIFHHVTFTFKDGVAKSYLDGTHKTQDAYTPASLDLSGTFRLGGSNGRYYEGILNDVKIYDRCLSAEEVKTHYLHGLQSHGYIQSNNFTVFDSDWHEYMRFPTTNTSTLLVAGQSWFNTVTNELTIYNGTAWVSTTLT